MTNTPRPGSNPPPSAPRPAPSPAPPAAPGLDRALETPRRQRAVELLLSMGYQWHDGRWEAPLRPVDATLENVAKRLRGLPDDFGMTHLRNVRPIVEFIQSTLDQSTATWRRLGLREVIQPGDQILKGGSAQWSELEGWEVGLEVDPSKWPEPVRRLVKIKEN